MLNKDAEAHIDRKEVKDMEVIIVSIVAMVIACFVAVKCGTRNQA